MKQTKNCVTYQQVHTRYKTQTKHIENVILFLNIKKTPGKQVIIAKCIRKSPGKQSDYYNTTEINLLPNQEKF